MSGTNIYTVYGVRDGESVDVMVYADSAREALERARNEQYASTIERRPEAPRFPNVTGLQWHEAHFVLHRRDEGES